MKRSYILIIFFLISCKTNQLGTNEIRLNYEEKKEILSLIEFLLGYRVKNQEWPKDLKPGENNYKSFQKLNTIVSNDTIRVEFKIFKDLSDSTNIKSLEGRFNMFVNEERGLNIKNFPITVELRGGKILIDRNNIRSQ